MILERILESKARELLEAKALRSPAALSERPVYAEPRRGFQARLRDGEGRAVIAEIKRASPSKGLIREDFDPVAHAADYERAGARCISVLTDAEYFGGSLDYLEAVRGACSLPLLRKDFMIDPYQMIEARAYGADAVLLIVAALERSRLDELAAAAREQGLDVLTEVHDESELQTALDSGAALIGINNRNLSTFETSINVTRRLAGLVPDEVTLVSESGLEHPHQLAQLEALGVDAFLIGERLMAQPDPGQALRAMLAV